jgi:small-conductance mechanosensitive channel
MILFLMIALCLVTHAAAETSTNPAVAAASSPAAVGSSVATNSVWSERLAQVDRWLAPLLGPWVRGEAILGISWLQVVLAAAVLLLVALTWQVLRALMRAWIRKDARAASAAPTAAPPAERERPNWAKLTLEASLPPLTLLVWVWGACAAVAVLLAQLQTDAGPLLRLASWARDVGGMGALFWFIFRMIGVVDARLKRWAARTESKWDDVAAALLVRGLRLVVPLAGVILILPTLRIPVAAQQFFQQGSSLVLIGAIGFIAHRLAHTLEQAVLAQYRVDARDNLEARKIYTQVQVLRKLAVVIIVIFTVGSMLMVFDSVRQVGASILASAGVLGIIVGFAAQRSIATVVAGFQIAMTQPIRIDDVVIVENEWGRIEEITLTYVVVRIWDLRRLIVPISYFIEKPFQNWTRVSADLLGSVFIYADYTLPLQALRAEVDRLLENSKLWDRKVKVVQVTDSKPNVMEVRVLVSASDAGSAWDLRCELREKLIDFVQREYPQCLPRVRTEVPGGEHLR